jgi:hypothetical protein
VLENLLLFLILFAALANAATFYANLLRPLATGITRLAKEYRITVERRQDATSPGRQPRQQDA